ncbi:unnamed protein product [Somion occarium]|uniref:Uncharacterized protein n=1 Tax=Somion occarium TaxID=3059160 RepID=A0ABP1E293_9APHY
MTLSLNSTHFLIAGSASDTVLKMATRVPPSLDVIHKSDVTFSISATMDGSPTIGKDLKESALALYLVNFLQSHSGQLGLSNVSELYLDESDGRTKFTVSSCSQLDPEDCTLYLTLLSIDLSFSCRSIPGNHVEDPLLAINPFASHAYLPFMSVLGNVFYRFITHHLIARYPLIFGSCCNKINAELPLLPSICRSLLNIVDRSADPTFRKRARKALKKLNSQYIDIIAANLAALSRYLGLSNEDLEGFPDPERTLTREQMLHRSLVTFLKHRIKPFRFKPLPTLSSTYTAAVFDLVPDTSSQSTVDEAPLTPAELEHTESPSLTLDIDNPFDYGDEDEEKFDEYLDASDNDLPLNVLDDDNSDEILDDDIFIHDVPTDDFLEDLDLPASPIPLLEDELIWLPEQELDDSGSVEAVGTPPELADDLWQNHDMLDFATNEDCADELMSFLGEEHFELCGFD